MIKVYSDTDYIPDVSQDRLTHLLDPFLNFNLTKDSETRGLKEFCESAHDHFQLTAIEDCDFVICPYHCLDNSISDDADALPIKDSFLFRTSLLNSAKSLKEFPLPAFCEDFIKLYLNNTPNYREKKLHTQPVVGFCGVTNNVAETKNHVKRFIRKLAYEHIISNYRLEKLFRSLGINLSKCPGRRIRTQALQVLKTSPYVQSNFIVRDRFFNGIHTISEEQKKSFRQQTQEEYLKNTLSSDYVLCPRGAGNYSYRLYETLCCGRIPVFINTDSTLPFDHIIDWKKHCIYIEENDIPRLPEIIAEFHSAIAPEDFLAMQKSNRKLWEDYLSMNGFYKNLHKYLKHPIVTDQL